MAEARLGKEGDWQELDGIEANREVSVQMAQQVRRNLDLFTQDLDPNLYDDADFVDAVTRLGSSGPNARIRILVNDPTTAIRQGHRLLAVAQRLPSFVEIRQPEEGQRSLAEAWLIADGCGVVRRTLATSYRAQASFNASAEARQLLHRFDLIWEHATVPNDLRRLSL